MDTKELMDSLTNLKTELEGKSKTEIKDAIEAFETKHKEILELKFSEVIDTKTQAIKDEFEKEIKELKDYASKLEIKMQTQTKGKNKVDGIKELITDNFENIAKVSKGSKVNIESKDMTLPVNLTGDQPRDYSMDVAMIPSQLINVADIVGGITISGGTYTYPLETAPTGTAGAQVEGELKDAIDYNLSMIDANTDFIAGISVYSRKMANNLPFLESFIPRALRRDYWKAENGIFNGILEADATASTQIITGQNKIEMLIAEIAGLEGANFEATAIVMTPADYWDIMITEKSTGSGYGLPGVVTLQNGQLRINGIPLLRATWVTTNKYFVGDWSRVSKVTTEGLSVQFSTEDSDNFRRNNITARVEAQVTLAVEQPAALIYGDFTAA